MRGRDGAVAFRQMLPALLASRLLWFAVFIAVALIDMPGTSPLAGIRTQLLSWDARSYVDIATAGYPAHFDYHDAFLPGYPLLIASVTAVTRDAVVAGWLVSLVAQGIALWYIARLVSAERDRDAATFSVWIIALAPTALFFVALYTESPFVAAAAASLYHARRGNARAAAIAAAIACAIRLTGIALLPALLIEQLAPVRARRASRLRWLLVVPAPLLAYGVYMQLRVGDALALVHAQQLPSFGHAPAFPWSGLVTTWHAMSGAASGEMRSIFAREIAFGLLGLVACIAMWVSPRIPRSFALYCTLAWLLTASLTYWRSEPRYDLALFPAVLVAVDLTARVRALRPAVLAASGALMCAGVSIYASGRWLG